MNKSGIIIIDKPKAMSTNHLIQKVKRKLDIKKIGHAGTLDPLATGVVVCLINNATKLSDYFLNENKEYEFEITLFQSTSTYDAEGEITNNVLPFDIDLSDIQNIVSHFDNYTYNQIPPIFSAIKVDGKKLYKYAREDKTVEIKSREITIKKLELINYDKVNNKISLRAKCSKGTYIRSLAVDFAKELKTIGFISELRRIESGNFYIKDAIKIDDIQSDNLISTYDALSKAGLPTVVYDKLIDVEHGKQIEINSIEPIVFIVDKNQKVYACYEKQCNNFYKCKRGGLNDASN